MSRRRERESFSKGPNGLLSVSHPTFTADRYGRDLSACDLGPTCSVTMVSRVSRYAQANSSVLFEISASNLRLL